MSKEVRMMDDLTVDDQRRAGGKDNGAYGASLHGHAQHRRSKSASEKSLKVSRGGYSQCTRKVLNESAQNLALPPRSCRASPLQECSTSASTDATSNRRASLEKDIEHLQLRLQQERSMHMLLERAMGRSSSILSPGHRHFAPQTKELIAEIELLEEEVANREQHALSLYRSIFEQCLSRPSSEQSSVMTSPAHIKNESRKHPSIISSSFCSSKKFSLRTLQALASIRNSKKGSLSHSKSKHTSPFCGKVIVNHEKSNPNHVKDQEEAKKADKTSDLRTLRDHLYQCPSKLSEEMVRCMASVYCWLSNAASKTLEKKQLPALTRSANNVILPQHCIKEGKDWSHNSAIEVSWISTDKKNFPRASFAMNSYRALVEQLEKVNVNQMGRNAQIAFWINLYNSLVMHAYLAYGIPHNALRRLALFHKAAYNIGGQIISANAIEQSVLCLRTPRVGKWLETVLSTAMRKRSGEVRQLMNSKLRLQNSEPLVCFALCTGAFSDPMLKVYEASKLQEELEAAKREFLQTNLVVRKSKKVFLPKVLERFAKEASVPSDDILKWVTENVAKKLSDSIQKCIDRRSNKKTSNIIEWLPYSSRFRYVFSKELTEKPWWA